MKPGQWWKVNLNGFIKKTFREYLRGCFIKDMKVLQVILDVQKTLIIFFKVTIFQYNSFSTFWKLKNFDRTWNVKESTQSVDSIRRLPSQSPYLTFYRFQFWFTNQKGISINYKNMPKELENNNILTDQFFYPKRAK